MGFINTKKYGSGNQTWLGSRHGVANAQTGTLKNSAFDGGVAKSGTPVKLDTDGLYVPATAAADVKGFVLGDTDVSDNGLGDGKGTPAAILWHGRIKAHRLPGDYASLFTDGEAVGQFEIVKEA